MINLIDRNPQLGSSAFKNSYFSRVLNPPFSIFNKLSKYLIDGKIGDFSLDKTQREIIDYIICNFELIIVGDVQALSKILEEFDRKKWSREFHNGKKATGFSRAITKCFNYSLFRKKNGSWLAQTIGIKSCPYCNAQYTLILTQKGRALLQFDHFFSKHKYPFFSLSLYNLVPCCANCNLTKSSNDLNYRTHFHPYHNSLNRVAKFYLNYDIKALDLNKLIASEESELEIIFLSLFRESEDFVTRHDKIYFINEIYKNHTDVARELLVKAILYNNHYQKAVSKIEGLFKDRDQLMRYILGHYIEENEILSRPLTKMYRDIAVQLKLIS